MRLGLAQYTTPHVIAVPGDVSATLGGTTFTNHDLVGVGRISASAIDAFGETFGSVSSLQITNWAGDPAGGYMGKFNILPDRGFNSGAFFADYAARIQTVDFNFTPYYGAANIGGIDFSTKIAAQNQIAITSPIGGVKFTYLDPTAMAQVPTTGLDPAAGTTPLFGLTMPYVVSYTGEVSPGGASDTFNNINRLPLDSEALTLKADGSGYVGDEYGAHIYYFNANKEIVGAIQPPAAMLPHTPAGTLNFQSTVAPVNGRRNNQGFEGVSLSPDGTRLFALLQSATRQDSDAANNQNAKNARLLVYDVSGSATPAAPIGEYVVQLPTYRLDGNGSAVNRTAAQSEVVALDDSRFLILSRDGNGLGNSATNPSMFKSVLLADLSVGSPTNFAGNAARDAEGGLVTTASGVLDAAITPVSWTEVVNMLNETQLNKFNIELDQGGASQVSKLTLGEKWEGLSLVSANDPTNPNDYFLFVANDNDFLTSDGTMRGPDGTLVPYDGFDGYPASRLPAAVGDATNPVNHENDTMFLAYRVTIAVPEPATAGLVLVGGLIMFGMRRRDRSKRRTMCK